jgi:hypothetical protein
VEDDGKVRKGQEEIRFTDRVPIESGEKRKIQFPCNERLEVIKLEGL